MTRPGTEPRWERIIFFGHALTLRIAAVLVVALSMPNIAAKSTTLRRAGLQHRSGATTDAKSLPPTSTPILWDGTSLCSAMARGELLPVGFTVPGSSASCGYDPWVTRFMVAKASPNARPTL